MKHQRLDASPEVSRRMAHVRLKRGIAETLLGRTLWHRGIRFRYNHAGLAGSPDIVIPKYGIAIFVDGEFWHGKDWEQRKKSLKKNREYWIEKIEENMARDLRNDAILRDAGWFVFHFWEREVKKDLQRCVSDIFEKIFDTLAAKADIQMSRKCMIPSKQRR